MAPLTIEDPGAEARLQHPREYALLKTLSGSDSEVQAMTQAAPQPAQAEALHLTTHWLLHAGAPGPGQEVWRQQQGKRGCGQG
jgi:hypothetical protein